MQALVFMECGGRSIQHCADQLLKEQGLDDEDRWDGITSKIYPGLGTLLSFELNLLGLYVVFNVTLDKRY